MQSEQSSSSRLEACLTKCNRFFVPTRYPPRHLVSIVYILLDIPIFTHCRILSVPISTTEVVVGTRIQRYYFVISANFSILRYIKACHIMQHPEWKTEFADVCQPVSEGRGIVQQCQDTFVLSNLTQPSSMLCIRMCVSARPSKRCR